MYPKKIFAIAILVLSPNVLAFVFGPSSAYYLYISIAAGLTFFWCKKTNLYKKSKLFYVIAFAFVLQFFVGVVNAIIGSNDGESWIIYSLLGAFQVVAYYSGLSLSRNSNSFKNGIIPQIVVLGFLDFSQFITRFGVLGLSIRASTGFTFLFPILTAYIFNNKKLHFRKISLLLLICTFVALISLSGLRSIFVLGVLLVLISLLALLKSVKKTGVNFIGLVLMGAILIVGVAKISSMNETQRAIDIVFLRFSQTIFADSGFRLDPGEGRYEEAQLALAEFNENASVIDYIFGRGYGFTFRDNSKDNLPTAHVHLTAVAYYVRAGVVGVVTYIFIIIYCIFLIIKSLGFPENWLIYICTGLWGLSSLFAGLIIGPSFWFLLGYSSGIQKKKSNKSVVINFGRK